MPRKYTETEIQRIKAEVTAMAKELYGPKPTQKQMISVAKRYGFL